MKKQHIVYKFLIITFIVTLIVTLAGCPAIANSGLMLDAPNPVMGTVSAPTFSPDYEQYKAGEHELLLNSATPGASIYYTLDGSEPNVSEGKKYVGAISIVIGKEPITIKAVATKIGFNNSNVVTKTFVEDGSVANVEMSPPGGGFKAGIKEVALSTETEGAEIYYTVDGTYPEAGNINHKYTQPFTITIGVMPIVVRAIAVLDGYTNSEMIEKVFTSGVVETPVLYPAPIPGDYTFKNGISITSGTVDVEFYYTVDGTTPTNKSTQAVGGLIPSSVVSAMDSVTVKVLAIKAHYEDSIIVTAEYGIPVKKYYVSSVGDDAFDGKNNDTAFASIQTAIDTVLAENNSVTHYVIEVVNHVLGVNAMATLTTNDVLNIILQGNSAGGILDANGMGRILYIEGDNVQLTLGNNLTLTGGSSAQGGALHINKADVHISGNTVIHNNYSASLTGGVHVVDGSLTMVDGTIENNTAEESGGGISVYNGKLSVSGGRITNNSVQSDTGDGGGIYLSSDSELELSGTPFIAGNTKNATSNNIKIANANNITLKGTLQAGSNIGITVYSEELGIHVIYNVLNGNEAYIHSDAGYVFVLNGTTLSVPLGLNRYVSEDGQDSNLGTEVSPFASVQAAVNSIIRENDNSSTYTIHVDGHITYAGPYNSYAMVNVNDSNLKLIVQGAGSENVEGSRPGVIDAGSEVTIAADGTISFGSSGLSRRVLYISGGVDVTLGANLTLTGGWVDQGAGVFVDNGFLAIEGATITANGYSGSSVRGGGVYLNSGSVTLTSGNIDSNALYSYSYSSTVYGAGVYNNNGILTIEGGSISNNSAYAAGGSVYGGGVYTANDVTMAGGSIEHNTLKSTDGVMIGGGVYLENTDDELLLEGDVIIRGNTISGDVVNNVVPNDNYAIYITDALGSNADVNITANFGTVAARGFSYILSSSDAQKVTRHTGGNFPLDSANNMLGFFPSTSQRDFYVDEHGSDIAGNGTVSSPLASVQAAINALQLINDESSIYTVHVNGRITENGNANTNGMVSITGNNELHLVIQGSEAGGIIDAGTKITINENEQPSFNVENSLEKRVMYILGQNLHVTLGENLTLTGGYASYGAGLYAYYGTITIDGTTISGNGYRSYSYPSGKGAGIYSDNGYECTITLKSGNIEGNVLYNSSSSSSFGAGAYLEGYFNMSGGSISNNLVYSEDESGYGGGVYISSHMTMTGGSISENRIETASGVGHGAGVYIGSSYQTLYVSGDVRIEQNTLTGDSLNNVVPYNDTSVYIRGSLGSNAYIGVSPKIIDIGIVVARGSYNPAYTIQEADRLKVVHDLTGQSFSLLENKLGFIPNPSQRDFYVATSGNDLTGNGSALQPYASVQTAVNAIKSINDQSSTYTIYVDGVITDDGNASGDGMVVIEERDDIALNLIIKGVATGGTLDAGADIIIDANGDITFNTENALRKRVLYVEAKDASITLGENLILTGGYYTSSYPYGGGGVCVYGGSVTIAGAVIKENIATISYAYSEGGGVYSLYDGAVTMTSGSIENNVCKATGSADARGGGVAGDFILLGGSITGNIAFSESETAYGGGVYGDDFTMSGGTISGNTVSTGSGIARGAGLYAQYNTNISGNIVIANNMRNDVNNNIESASDTSLYIRGAIGATADIGFTANYGTTVARGFTSPRYTITASDEEKLKRDTGGSLTLDTANNSVGVFPSTSQRDFYVSQEGSDITGDGTAAFPLASVQVALDAIQGVNDEHSTYTIIIDGIITTTTAGYGDMVSIEEASKVLNLVIKGSEDGGTLDAGYDFTIDSQGNITQGSSNSIRKRVFDINGVNTTVTLGSNLTITGGYDYDYGGGLYIERGNVLIDGASIHGNYAGDFGGGIYNSTEGTLTMSAGSIHGNLVSGYGYSYFYGGGGISNAGSFTMTGGSISDNFVKHSNEYNNSVHVGGGGVFMQNDVTITGGTISNNTIMAVHSEEDGITEELGGGIYIANIDAKLYVSGDVVISDNTSSDGSDNNVSLYNSNSLYIASALGSNANIGIFSKLRGIGTVIARGNPSPLYTITESDVRNIRQDGVDANFIINNNAFGIFPSLSQDEFYVSPRGSDTAGDGTELLAFKTVNKALSAIESINDERSMYTIIIDGVITDTGTVDVYSMVDIESSNTLNLTIKGSSTGGTLDAGSDVRIASNGTASIIASSSPKRVIYVDGDSLNVTLGENLTITGGYTGNYSHDSGGGMYINSGSVTIAGASIRGNGCSVFNYGGGGIYLRAGSLTMSRGSITENVSLSVSSSWSCSGGGVYVYDGLFTMSGGSVSGNIVSGSSTTYGGGIYNRGTLNITGGNISNNISNSTGSSALGAGVYSNDTFTMSGGSITDNLIHSQSSNAHGGGVYLNSDFTMSGGTITRNRVTTTSGNSKGGGIYIASTSAELYVKGDVYIQENGTSNIEFIDDTSVYMSGPLGTNANIGITPLNTSSIVVWADSSYTISSDDALKVWQDGTDPLKNFRLDTYNDTLYVAP